jgi:hypothetical protein
MIVGLIALVMAMGGSAVAGSLITSKQIKDGTIQKRDLSKRTIQSLRATSAGGIPGPQGPAGPAGPKGDTGAAGSTGAAGAAGTARAYAHVSSLGTLTTRKNVVGVEKIGTGDYCVKLDPSINASQTLGVVSADYSDAPSASLAYIRSSGGIDCAGMNAIEVTTSRVFVTTTGQPAGDKLSDTGFSVVVP